MSKINVYNNWDPLEEIWLGDVWPSHFYDNLEPEVRDNFYYLTECTKEDLAAIQKKFEEFGVIVRRPHIEDDRSKHTITDKSSILLKPPICPRDDHAVVGNRLFYDGSQERWWKPILDLYTDQIFSHSKDSSIPDINGANMVKIGRDIIFDHAGIWEHTDGVGSLQQRKEEVFKRFKSFEERELVWFGDKHRLHFSTEGGHLDSCYMPAKEGIVLTTKHVDNYDEILPNWKQIGIRNPSYMAEKEDYQGNALFVSKDSQYRKVPTILRTKDFGPFRKWLGNLVGLMDHVPPHFNQYIHEFCKSWIGNYKETYFEVNVVPIDEHNLICVDTSGLFDNLFEELEKNGITCHTVPWRSRGFWDGGIHCITLDVRRRSTLKDYFPDRGENGIATVNSSVFSNSTEIFLKEYNQWKSAQ